MTQTSTKIKKDFVKSEYGLVYSIVLIKIQNIQLGEINLLSDKFIEFKTFL